MATLFERDLPAAPGAGDAGPGEFDEERSIREALRVTLLFLAMVVLLLWAGITDAASPERLATVGQPAPLCLCGRP
jgi:hypothetical protein